MPELHLEILRPPQRRLWDALQGDAATLRAQGFLLAGGTALALQIGHRESHDFDFFSQASGIEPVRRWLDRLPDVVVRDADADTMHADIAGVKLSFIAGYRYPFLMPSLPAGNLGMARIVDIALMKMLAITHRAALRDYIDLAAILRDHCTLQVLVERSTEKYGPHFNVMLALRTMIHFDDLDEEVPVILDRDLAANWRQILRQAVKKVA